MIKFLLQLTLLLPDQLLWKLVNKNRSFPVPTFKILFLMFLIFSIILGLLFPVATSGFILLLYLFGGIGYLYERTKDFYYNNDELIDYRYQLNVQNLIKQFKEDFIINLFLSIGFGILSISIMQTELYQEVIDAIKFIPLFIFYIFFWEAIVVKIIGTLLKILKNLIN